MTVPANTDNSDIPGLSYERAREELVNTVRTLEAGNLPLEDSLRLWERGEALADHCQAWLDGARTKLDEAKARRESQD
ncbi:exodeoxyribonuclease VII small subunit [Brevibacterium samyangense]|uniref:Exodeoxyribonuclease 7 small subunit n=1 Tax=Brevibacterium samyangense TaxID=366888 RepID=A0ABP5ELD6_9MICO